MGSSIRLALIPFMIFFSPIILYIHLYTLYICIYTIVRDIKSLISDTVILDEKIIKELSSSIANEVANKIYYEFLLARYIPEGESYWKA